MLVELVKDPNLGLVGGPCTFISGRTILVWQQWRSFDLLEERDCLDHDVGVRQELSRLGKGGQRPGFRRWP